MNDEQQPGHGTRKMEGDGPPEDAIGMQQTQMTPAPEHRRLEGEAAPTKPTPERRYVFARRLGEGGMAVVYDAHDVLLDRPVAVKVLKKELVPDTHTLDRFFQEVHLLAQMDHPGIIPVHDQGTEPGEGPFYAMKRVEGKNLRELLRDYGEIELKKREVTASLLEVFERVCDAVAYAHSQGIIHRDLKPENIMVDDYGVVLVMDWGLAKRVAGSEQAPSPMHTQAGVILGTPYYMSPEQASGKVNEIDCRSDVFALGVVLYEILTGRLPFHGSTFEEVVEQLQESAPVHPRKRNKNVPRALAAICVKALSKDPEERYPSARELAQDLHCHEANLPTTAHRPSLTERLGNAVMRHPVRATALGMIGVVVLLAVAIAASIVESRIVRRRAQIELAATFEDSMSKAVDEVEDRVAEVQAQLRGSQELSAEARRDLEVQLVELSTARYFYLKQLDMVLVTVLPIVLREGADEKDAKLLSSWRQGRIAEFERMIADGDYYPVHYNVWTLIVGASLMKWSPDELDELLRIKSEVEAKMAAAYGEGFVPPDWEQYKPPMTLQDYFNQSMGRMRIPGTDGER